MVGQNLQAVKGDFIKNKFGEKKSIQGKLFGTRQTRSVVSKQIHITNAKRAKNLSTARSSGQR